ncbi:MAG: Flp pilus assembly protein CpaB [Thermoguttaceae bacterium]
MRPKSLALLMFSLGCAMVAAIGVHQWMTRRNAQTTTPGETVPVFVVTTDIGFGEMLSAQLLKEEQWPKDKVPPGTISRIEDIDGRRTRTKLYAGEPILENKLLGKGDRDQGATALIPKGYRVVSVKVDLVSGGSSLILPGDRVDVMVHLVKDLSHDIPETVTRTILRDIKVFAVNDVVGLESQKDGGKSIVAKTISLLVTPDQAAKVMLASQLGMIQLVMRGIEDEAETAATAQARPSELLGTASKGEAAKESEAVAKDAPEKKQSFVNFLDSMKNKPTSATATPTRTRATWTMRVLKPGAVEDVQFETDSANADSPDGGWKVSAPAGAAGPDAKPEPAAEPAADQPTPKAAPKVNDKGDRA